MKVKFQFPTITFETKEVEISDAEWEQLQLSSDWQKAEFIWAKLDDDERDWVPDRMKGIQSALDVGYTTIKPVHNG